MKMKNLLNILCVFCLATISINAHASEVENKVQLNICSYNIRGDKPVDGPSQWIFRKDSLCRIINENSFDIVCLQEAVQSQLEDILDRVNMEFVGVRGLFNPILFNSKRFELLHTEMFWLSETSNPCSVGWDGKYDRYCTWAKFKERETETEFFVFNTHLDHRGENAKREGAKLICEQAKHFAGNAPIIICGDMNSKDTTDAYVVYTSNFNDSRIIAKKVEGPIGTAHNFGKVEPVRIDYIFASNGIDILNYTVNDEEYGNGFYPSDHYPVYVKVDLLR